MFTRLKRCVIAWGIGTVIMILPVVCFHNEFRFGDEWWLVAVVFFAITFPAVLLVEFIFRKQVPSSRIFQTLVLICLLVLSEIEFTALPFELSQTQLNLNTSQLMVILLCTVPAAVVVLQILSAKKNLVIIQKEI